MAQQTRARNTRLVTSDTERSVCDACETNCHATTGVVVDVGVGAIVRLIVGMSASAGAGVGLITGVAARVGFIVGMGAEVGLVTRVGASDGLIAGMDTGSGLVVGPGVGLELASFAEDWHGQNRECSESCASQVRLEVFPYVHAPLQLPSPQQELSMH